jgi:hypothetical protein
MRGTCAKLQAISWYDREHNRNRLQLHSSHPSIDRIGGIPEGLTVRMDRLVPWHRLTCGRATTPGARTTLPTPNPPKPLTLKPNLFDRRVCAFRRFSRFWCLWHVEFALRCDASLLLLSSFNVYAESSPYLSRASLAPWLGVASAQSRRGSPLGRTGSGVCT